MTVISTTIITLPAGAQLKDLLKLVEGVPENARVSGQMRLQAGMGPALELTLSWSTTPTPKVIDVVFDKLPGAQGSTFIEIETPDGRGVKVGDWLTRSDGSVALRITEDHLRALPPQL